MAKLVLFGTEYEVSAEKIAYNEYRAIFYKEAQTAKQNLQDYYVANNLSNKADFDKVVEMGRTWINDALAMFVRTLTEKEIYDYSVDSIKRVCVVPLTRFEETVETIYNQLNEIDMEWRHEQLARQQEIDSASSSWSGGGFGLEGALKGAATAAVLNAASGAVTKAFTSGDAKRAASAHEMKIYNLLNDTDTVIEMSLALYDDIFSLVKTYVKILEEDKNEKISVVSDEEIMKSNDIFTNIKSGVYDAKPEVEQQMWIKLFTLYPYETNYFIYLLKVHNEVFEEVVKLIQWYNLPMEVVADTLLAEKYNFEIITELEDAQEQKELLTADLNRFGITESNLMYIADEQIGKILIDRRTYERVIYDTEEDCEYARVLDSKLQEEVTSVDKESLESLVKLYVKILNEEDEEKYLNVYYKNAEALHELLRGAIQNCTSQTELLVYKTDIESSKHAEIYNTIIKQMDSKMKSIAVRENLNESKEKIVGAAKGLLGKAKGMFKK